jgi:hypothetical protein
MVRIGGGGSSDTLPVLADMPGALIAKAPNPALPVATAKSAIATTKVTVSRPAGAKTTRTAATITKKLAK